MSAKTISDAITNAINNSKLTESVTQIAQQSQQKQEIPLPSKDKIFRLANDTSKRIRDEALQMSECLLNSNNNKNK